MLSHHYGWLIHQDPQWSKHAEVIEERKHLLSEGVSHAEQAGAIAGIAERHHPSIPVQLYADPAECLAHWEQGGGLFGRLALVLPKRVPQAPDAVPDGLTLIMT